MRGFFFFGIITSLSVVRTQVRIYEDVFSIAFVDSLRSDLLASQHLMTGVPIWLDRSSPGPQSFVKFVRSLSDDPLYFE